MTGIFAELALVDGRWLNKVKFDIVDGRIAAIAEASAPDPEDERADVVVPGMPNVHSHAFQRAMAGLAEVRGSGADSFWSWRSVMYQFALTMDPEDVERVASELYMEMLEAGFTRVGEFHYLHHDRDGRPYADIAEIAGRISAASAEAGINLTLLPVFYAHSNFGGVAPIEGQRRFINDIDRFSELHEACARLMKTLPGGNLGLALHSLRAVTPEEMTVLLKEHRQGPCHIHISEQVKEVEDCLAWSKARPVEWLLANAPVDERWCLIHATHMTEAETANFALSGAIAGLCPITEANLGDGIFPASTFLEAGGRFGIGSDSNISISVVHELRQLEYSQRLLHRARNVIADSGRSTGRKLFDNAVRGGSQALGVDGGFFVGAQADMVGLRADHFFGSSPDQVLDNWLFADGVRVESVWVRGRKLVSEGRHFKRDDIERRFRSTMRKLAKDA